MHSVLSSPGGRERWRPVERWEWDRPINKEGMLRESHSSQAVTRFRRGVHQSLDLWSTLPVPLDMRCGGHVISLGPLRGPRACVGYRRGKHFIHRQQRYCGPHATACLGYVEERESGRQMNIVGRQAAAQTTASDGLARSFFFLLHGFVSTRYQNVELVFIAHEERWEFVNGAIVGKKSSYFLRSGRIGPGSGALCPTERWANS